MTAFGTVCPAVTLSTDATGRGWSAGHTVANPGPDAPTAVTLRTTDAMPPGGRLASSGAYTWNVSVSKASNRGPAYEADGDPAANRVSTRRNGATATKPPGPGASTPGTAAAGTAGNATNSPGTSAATAANTATRRAATLRAMGAPNGNRRKNMRSR